VVRSYFSENFDNSTGRFIDVGAFHPFIFSNTVLLSKLGWRGINILSWSSGRPFVLAPSINTLEHGCAVHEAIAEGAIREAFRHITLTLSDGII
jgi:hypothetical protein